jgi:hypothetical protein
MEAATKVKSTLYEWMPIHQLNHFHFVRGTKRARGGVVNRRTWAAYVGLNKFVRERAKLP